MIPVISLWVGALAAAPHPEESLWIRSCVHSSEGGCSLGWTELELSQESGRYDWRMRQEYASRYHRNFQPSQWRTWCERDDNGLACTMAGSYGEGDPALLTRGCQLGDPDGCALYALIVGRERPLSQDERGSVQQACRDGSPRACAVWLDGVLQDPSWGGLADASRGAQFACTHRSDWLACAAVARQVAADGRPELAGRLAALVHAGTGRRAAPGRVLTAPIGELAVEMVPSLPWIGFYNYDLVRVGALEMVEWR